MNKCLSHKLGPVPQRAHNLLSHLFYSKSCCVAGYLVLSFIQSSSVFTGIFLCLTQSQNSSLFLSGVLPSSPASAHWPINILLTGECFYTVHRRFSLHICEALGLCSSTGKIWNLAVLRITENLVLSTGHICLWRIFY